MKKSGINVIRIAESTWSTHEPREGVFDFSSLTAMLDCAVKYDLKVIVGTPTYAIPSWLYHKHMVQGSLLILQTNIIFFMLRESRER